MTTVESEAPIVVTDPRLSADEFITEGLDERNLERMETEPRFTVSEVAKVFFGVSPHWVRWREKKGFFVLDGNDDECEHLEPFESINEDTEQPVTKFRSAIVDGKCPNCGGIDVSGHRTAKGSRSYSLPDVERMAHALAQKGGIDGSQLANTLLAVQTVARIWRFL